MAWAELELMIPLFEQPPVHCHRPDIPSPTCFMLVVRDDNQMVQTYPSIGTGLDKSSTGPNRILVHCCPTDFPDVPLGGRSTSTENHCFTTEVPTLLLDFLHTVSPLQQSCKAGLILLACQEKSGIQAKPILVSVLLNSNLCCPMTFPSRHTALSFRNLEAAKDTVSFGEK